MQQCVVSPVVGGFAPSASISELLIHCLHSTYGLDSIEQLPMYVKISFSASRRCGTFAYIISYEYVTSGLGELPFENAFKALTFPKTKSDYQQNMKRATYIPIDILTKFLLIYIVLVHFLFAYQVKSIRHATTPHWTLCHPISQRNISKLTSEISDRIF